MYWILYLLFIYSNATQLTYSLIGLLAMARRVIWIRSVHPSVQTFSWNWPFTFFQELKMVLRAHAALCMTEPDFLKKMFYPQNGENRPSPGFSWMYRKVQFFSRFFIFLSVWSIMKVCITVILVCLNKFHIWENSGFWDMAQNALGQSDCRIFQSIAGL